MISTNVVISRGLLSSYRKYDVADTTGQTIPDGKITKEDLLFFLERARSSEDLSVRQKYYKKAIALLVLLGKKGHNKVEKEFQRIFLGYGKKYKKNMAAVGRVCLSGMEKLRQEEAVQIFCGKLVEQLQYWNNELGHQRFNVQVAMIAGADNGFTISLRTDQPLPVFILKDILCSIRAHTNARKEATILLFDDIYQGRSFILRQPGIIEH